MVRSVPSPSFRLSIDSNYSIAITFFLLPESTQIEFHPESTALLIINA